MFPIFKPLLSVGFVKASRLKIVSQKLFGGCVGEILVNFIKVVFFLFFGFMGASATAENRYVSFNRSPVENLPYIAITSEEVKKIIGMYQSSNNEKEVIKVILKRASNICSSQGYKLLDFEIESESSRGRYALVDNFGKVKVISDDSKVSGGMVALNFGSAGLFGLIAFATRAGWRGVTLAVGTDLGISYGIDLALRAMEDLDLKGWLSYHYAYFKKVNCLDTKSLDDSNINQAKLSYFCPKLLNGGDCKDFQLLGYFQCFLAARKAGYRYRYSFHQCADIASDAQAGCVGASVANSWKLGYSVNHCSTIETAPQGIAAIGMISHKNRYYPKYAVEQALRIESPAQAEVVVKAMDQWKLSSIIDQVRNYNKKNPS